MAAGLCCYGVGRIAEFSQSSSIVASVHVRLNLGGLCIPLLLTSTVANCVIMKRTETVFAVDNTSW